MTTDPTSGIPAGRETTPQVSTSEAESSATEAAPSEPPMSTTPAAAVAGVEPAEEPTPLDPAIASEVMIPAVSGSDAHADQNEVTGGEWDQLSAKLAAWWQEQNLTEQWQRLSKPLVLAGGLLGLILVLRIYSAFLTAVASVPLAPRLFELVGVSWLAWFSLTHLIRSDERRKVMSGLRERWQSFRGSSGQ